MLCRMRGGYADSGNFQAPNSKSVLEYHLPNVAAGAEVLFSYISSGETGYDYMQFSVCMGERSQAFDVYKTVTGESWKREKLVLSLAGEYTLKWVYIKDATTDQGVDEARLLEVAITGFSDDGGCTECPADHCSMGRIDGCQVHRAALPGDWFLCQLSAAQLVSLFASFVALYEYVCCAGLSKWKLLRFRVGHLHTL